jgi:hypothetical protein
MVVTSYPPRRGNEDPCWEDLAKYTCATQAKYCQKWGYDYYVDVSSVSAPVRSPWVDDRKGGYAPMRTMIKFPLLEHWLTKEACGKEYDYVVWIDADCVVTNYELPLTKWLNGMDGEGSYIGDLVLAKDVNGLHPTIIMVRNTKTTRGLIWACGNAGRTMYMQHDWSDILAFRFFLDTPPYDHLVMYYSAKELCAMPPSVYTIPPDVRAEYEWDQDSWTLHLSALTIEKRIEFAKHAVEKLNLL